MLETINSFIWGSGLVFLLIAAGVVYTVRLKGIQLRMIPYIAKNRGNRAVRRAQLRTLCMSLGTAMGTGNITGVASAIAIGGAGAVFWMWVSAFFGMALVYAENYLSAAYSDSSARGPMAYLKNGLGSPRLAAVFAFCCVLASFGMGGMVQTSSMSESIRSCAHIPPMLIAAAIFAVLFFVICGGAGRIESSAQMLLPFATVAYAVLCIIAIFHSRSELPTAAARIFREALGLKQAAGGVCGYGISRAISAGIRRGVFSNEAGLGSSPILHSSSQNSSQGELQGVCSMLEVFIDTMLCCTLTALAILCASEDGTVHSAISAVTGAYTGYVLAVLMTLFAFCTVIGWYYCGETAFSFLLPRVPRGVFALAFAALAASGAVIRAEQVWTLSDIFNGAMAFPNLVGLLLLMGRVKGIKRGSSDHNNT